MRVLVACEFSGAVRREFRARGHEAWSCDLLPSEDDGEHIQGDVLKVLEMGWDLMVAHPPLHTSRRQRGSVVQGEEEGASGGPGIRSQTP